MQRLSYQIYEAVLQESFDGLLRRAARRCHPRLSCAGDSADSRAIFAAPSAVC